MTHFLLIAGCIVSGLLAASRFIEERFPQIGSLVRYLSPFRVYIGFFTLIMGLVKLLSTRDVLTGLAGIAVGAVLAVGLLSFIPSLRDETRDKISMTLLGFQTPIGIVAIVVGLIALFFGWGENRLF